MKVLIVGAGPTGAIVADLLRKLRCKVPPTLSIWEKSKGCGGRMTTTRFRVDDADTTSHPISVDTGAQYISSTLHYQQQHSSIYTRLINDSVIVPMIDKEIINERLTQGTKNFVCPNGINTIAKYFIHSSGADLKLETRTIGLSCNDNSVLVSSGSGDIERFDCVILTIPTPQIMQLEGINDLLGNDQRSLLEAVQYSSRFALAIKLPMDFEPPVSWTAMYVTDDPCIRYISLDTKKRDKGQPHTLLVHTSVPYGCKHLEEEKDKVGEDILKSVMNLLPWLPSTDRLDIKSHKWRYSQVHQAVPDSPGYITLNTQPRIVACGDAFTHSNLDGCVSSAIKTVDSLQTMFE